jgi:putative ABC transport system permease protein
MNSIAQDIRYSLRALRATPGFTMVAVLTLALGIGANTAIFSVVHAVLLKPLAYDEPGELVSLKGLVQVRGTADVTSSAPEYRNYRDDVPSMKDAAAIWPISINLTGTGDPERIQAAVVSPNYTKVLGVEPLLGRTFTPQDPGGRIGYVVLISYDLWQRWYQGDSAAIGKVVRLDDDPMTIIGVMPQGFRHPLETGASPMEVWAPIDFDNPDPNFVNVRRFRMLEVVGRLKPDVSVAKAQGELDVLTARLKRDFPNDYPANEDWRASLSSLSERVTGNVRPALLILVGAVGLVLLIACVNVANLMLSRAAGRGREIAIRTALGSSRSRLIRQLLTESIVLSLLGGVLGLVIAIEGTSALSRLATLYLPRARDIGINGIVLAFTALVSVATGVAFGLLPAWQASRADLQSALKEGGRGTSAGTTRTRLRGSLVVAEIALALMLVAGAGLLLRSFQRLVAIEPGFEPANVLAMQMWLAVPNDAPQGRFFTVEQRQAFYSRMLEAMAQAPGVREAALVSRLPFRGRTNAPFFIDGRPTSPDEQPPRTEIRTVSPGYFAAMGIPLLRGPGLPAFEDSASSFNSVVINQTLAEKHFANDDPVGRRIRIGSNPQAPWLTIRGVVGAIRQISLEEPPREEIYFSYRRFAGQETAFIVKTAGDPGQAKPAILEAIRSVDPQQPVFGMMPMQQLLDDANAPRRFSLLLLTLFAVIALLLAAIGIYGVMAYTTAQRKHEMGLRLALGARPLDVVRLVLRQGMRLVALGVAIGLAGAWALSRVLRQQLFEITPGDPVTYLGAAAVLGLVALVANYVPARRATGVDPMVALRSE